MLKRVIIFQIKKREYDSKKGGVIMFNFTPWTKDQPNEMTYFIKDMGNLFEKFLEKNSLPAKEFFTEKGWFPKLDVSEGKSNITVKAEIPGVDAKDIDLSISGKILTINGEKKEEKEENEKNYHRVERSYGSFYRTVELPAEVDSVNVDASYKKGVLTIELKKTKESEVKKIEVKTD